MPGKQRVNVVDIPGREVTPAVVTTKDERIAAIEPITSGPAPETYLLPGFIDAHVHIESSMLAPTEFARAAVAHGTVATVSDPHEIGNVLGVAGVRYMQENAAKTPLKIYFGAPACVPATPFETAGAELTAADVARLLDDPRIRYLSEMMDFPGVLKGDPDVMEKMAAARRRGKPVDGHAPGLRGEEVRRYVEAGPSTDHECYTIEEARDQLAAGAAIAIREGSAARNFEALYPLLGEHPGRTMLCSDDKHPDELLAGHINVLVRRAVERGIDVFDVLHAACVTPVAHYGLDVGHLRPGDPADMIEVDSLERFEVLRTWIDGRLVAERGKTRLPRSEPAVVNRFEAAPIAPGVLRVEAPPGERLQINVIEATDGQLVTSRATAPARTRDGALVSDVENDVLKIVVVNRYAPAPPAVAFIRHFGLRRGALASSVAHDSHNIIAVGASDEALSEAINLVIEARGGLSAVGDGKREVLPLPIAGLMATGTCAEVGAAYARLDRFAKDLGSPLRAPYMTLSFMALLVIPEIKLSDQGLFDARTFEFMPIAKEG